MLIRVAVVDVAAAEAQAVGQTRDAGLRGERTWIHMGFLIMILVTVVGFFVFRAIARPSWKSRDASVRRRAVEELTSETLLVRLAATDPDPLVRSAAVKNFHCRDQVLLEERAMADVDPKVRKAARERLEYPELLKLLWASSDLSLLSYVKPSATSDLARLALSHPNGDVRKAALEKMGTSAGVESSILSNLERIAQESQDPAVRHRAEERLSSERERLQKESAQANLQRAEREKAAQVRRDPRLGSTCSGCGTRTDDCKCNRCGKVSHQWRDWYFEDYGADCYKCERCGTTSWDKS